MTPLSYRGRLPNGDPEGSCPPRARRCLSAWCRRRETHSRTPYPSAKPTIRMIAISSIGSRANIAGSYTHTRELRWNRTDPPLRQTIKRQLTYVNLTGASSNKRLLSSQRSVAKIRLVRGSTAWTVKKSIAANPASRNSGKTGSGRLG